MKANARHFACLFYSLLFTALPQLLHAQGAKAFTLGGRGLMQRDLFTGYNNPALAVQVKSHGLAASSSSFYAIRAFKQMDISYVKPIHTSLFALSWGQLGNSIYRENNYSLSLAQKANAAFSFGIRSDYRALSIQGYGKTDYFNLDVYTCLIANAVLSSSMAFNGCLQAGREVHDVQKNQRGISWGLQIQSDEKLSFIIEIEKPFHFSARLNSGLLYQPDSALQLSLGFSNAFKETGLGIQVNKKRVVYSAAVKIHWQLGISHHISLAYAFKN